MIHSSYIKKVASTYAPATRHYEDKKTTVVSRFQLSTLRITAALAVLAAVFEDELLAAVRAFLLFVDDAVGYIFLQGTGNAVLPGVDAFFLNIEVLYQFYHILDRHAVAQDA